MCQVLFWALGIQLWSAPLDPIPIFYFLKGFTPAIVAFSFWINFASVQCCHHLYLHVITPILEWGNSFDLKPFFSSYLYSFIANLFKSILTHYFHFFFSFSLNTLQSWFLCSLLHWNCSCQWILKIHVAKFSGQFIALIFLLTSSW